MLNFLGNPRFHGFLGVLFIVGVGLFYFRTPLVINVLGVSALSPTFSPTIHKNNSRNLTPSNITEEYFHSYPPTFNPTTIQPSFRPTQSGSRIRRYHPTLAPISPPPTPSEYDDEYISYEPSITPSYLPSFTPSFSPTICNMSFNPAEVNLTYINARPTGQGLLLELCEIGLSSPMCDKIFGHHICSYLYRQDYCIDVVKILTNGSTTEIIERPPFAKNSSIIPRCFDSPFNPSENVVANESNAAVGLCKAFLQSPICGNIIGNKNCENILLSPFCSLLFGISVEIRPSNETHIPTIMSP